MQRHNMKYLIFGLIFIGTLCSGQALFRAQNVSSATVTFTGPGDIITSNAVAWWGLRAYSTATRGNKLANVCDAGDAHCVDMLSDATTGNAVIPSSNPNCTTSSCTVKTLYDLTGQTNCDPGGGGFSCDVTQATIANRPTLTVNCVGSTHPCLTWSGSGQQLESIHIALTQTQPFSVVVIAKRTSFTSVENDIIGQPSGFPWRIAFNATANTVMFNGGGADATGSASDGAAHAIQTLFNGTSSVIAIDGSSSSVSTGTNSINGGLDFLIGGVSQPAINTVSVEFGIFGGDKSANFSALNSNQHAYWGF